MLNPTLRSALTPDIARKRPDLCLLFEGLNFDPRRHNCPAVALKPRFKVADQTLRTPLGKLAVNYSPMVRVSEHLLIHTRKTVGIVAKFVGNRVTDNIFGHVFSSKHRSNRNYAFLRGAVFPENRKPLFPQELYGTEPVLRLAAKLYLDWIINRNVGKISF
ncbi:MAG: hypothetical protein UT84_C0007G0010 [Candidatus Curtissbacteria bacterium GW2011_GWA1_40_16]|uniref:Uncharacterized protein n=1 Tax=Candidatus Curtissbacteria bacterium GW2011_GWA1_40_16 TaxID=1618405 RepID=A0A0G0RDG5_9BACT|nr:MAG: hypothetical protein UT84_C0007G0010 [Candidatus Curtissbacteria bacterium GW2011_GWA1_40_16]